MRRSGHWHESGVGAEKSISPVIAKRVSNSSFSYPSAPADVTLIGANDTKCEGFPSPDAPLFAPPTLFAECAWCWWSWLRFKLDIVDWEALLLLPAPPPTPPPPPTLLLLLFPEFCWGLIVSRKFSGKSSKLPLVELKLRRGSMFKKSTISRLKNKTVCLRGIRGSRSWGFHQKKNYLCGVLCWMPTSVGWLTLQEVTAGGSIIKISKQYTPLLKHNRPFIEVHKGRLNKKKYDYLCGSAHA